MKVAPVTLANLIRPFNQSEIARQLDMDRKPVNKWARDESSPAVQHLPKLAEIVRIDLAELTSIVANDIKRRSEFRASATVAA